MYNYMFLVGRLVRDIEPKTTSSQHDVATMTLAVNRPFKNSQTNTYDCDFLNITLWDQVCLNTCQYCKKGDMVAVKGRVQTRVEQKEENSLYHTELIAERVIFISSNKNTED